MAGKQGWLLNRQETGQPAPTCPSEGAPEQDYATEYLTVYREICGEMGGIDRTINTLQEGISKTFFEQRKSRINTTLKQSLSIGAAAYLISTEDKRPSTRYRIALNNDQIQYQLGE